ncbi:phosphatase PAP2 family protein [Carnimonas nigrificans]|uniref:phosphatase PAP2 family protein n=1 Tax=Carnimonas nigrificans TaxID=64323 RepID=UPI0004708287|nr:phosphatase PAP2 family protein [Carnimonas nigrificans]
MNIAALSRCYMAAFLLLGSWFILHSQWDALDTGLFFYFNQYLTPEHPLFVKALALTNARFFDSIIFCTMLAILVINLVKKLTVRAFCYWFSVALVMSACSGVATHIIHEMLEYTRPSPAYLHDHVHLITALTDYNVKDAVSNSFPGDHGVHAMIFAAFMLRFASRPWAAIAIVLALLVTCPRIMVGAHAFSDVYVGSLTLVLLLTPWFLFTPLQRWVETRLMGLFRPRPNA